MTEEKNKNNLKKYAKFSGIGLQMGVGIYFGSLIGKWLDAKYEMEKPIFTLLCIMFFFICSMYIMIRSLNKMNKDD